MFDLVTLWCWVGVRLERVEDVHLPHFITPPIVLVWGNRVFVQTTLVGDKVPPGREPGPFYVESFCYVVPIPPIPESGR